MIKIKLLTVCLMLVLTVSGCGSRAAKVREKLDLGSKYIEELDYDNAIEVLYEAIDIDPKDPDAYMMLAEVYIKDANVDKAKEILEEALEIEDLSEEKEDEINEKLSGLLYLVTISKAAGEYDEPFVLELSNLSDKDIYYTIESKNSRLATAEVKYTGPILLDEDGDYKIKAYTFDSDKKANDAIKAKYSIKLSKKYKEKNSWVHYGDIYRYRGEDSKIVTKWKEIDGKWYYFMDNGDMATGTVDIDGSKYHFNNGGVMLTDWQNIDGKWYYLGSDGIIKTGAQEVGGKKYYFDDNGVMLTGWQNISDAWYYITEKGEVSIGWQNIDGKWYYFAEDGKMITNQYIGTYYVGADGAMVDEAKAPKTETSDNSDVKKLYRDALTKLYTTGELGKIEDLGLGLGYSYELIDVNGDGIEDLIVSVNAHTVYTYVEIFTAIEGQLKSIFYDRMLYMCGLSNHAIFLEDATHGVTPYSYYEYDKNEKIYRLVKEGYTGDDGGNYDDSQDQAFINDIEAKNSVIWDYGDGAIEVTPENIAALK